MKHVSHTLHAYYYRQIDLRLIKKQIAIVATSTSTST
jgi:hypothetical protein